MSKYEMYKEIRKYIEDTYGAYSLETIGNARKFSIGWSGEVANEIHIELEDRFGFELTEIEYGLKTEYKHENELEIAIYLDRKQSPSRYYLHFGWLL